jgi:hypothetical protein
VYFISTRISGGSCCPKEGGVVYSVQPGFGRPGYSGHEAHRCATDFNILPQFFQKKVVYKTRRFSVSTTSYHGYQFQLYF